MREPLRLGDVDFGAIRVGISTLLVRTELERELQPVLETALYVLAGATLVALLLATSRARGWRRYARFH